MMFQYEGDARRVLSAMRERRKKFALEVAEEKTRILPFGRFRGGKEDFDFLGFTFYNTRARTHKYRIGIRISGKKLKAKKQAAKEWPRKQRHMPVICTMKTLTAVIRGHCNYYGVNHKQLVPTLKDAGIALERGENGAVFAKKDRLQKRIDVYPAMEVGSHKSNYAVLCVSRNALRFAKPDAPDAFEVIRREMLRQND